MQITRNSLLTNAGPAEWFAGTVFVDTVAKPSEQSRLSASSAHFTPGARTAWHTHPKLDFEVALPSEIGTTGVILTDQIKSQAWSERNAEYMATLPLTVFQKVLASVLTLLTRG